MGLLHDSCFYNDSVQAFREPDKQARQHTTFEKETQKTLRRKALLPGTKRSMRNFTIFKHFHRNAA
jgi:hypothetical protein